MPTDSWFTVLLSRYFAPDLRNSFIKEAQKGGIDFLCMGLLLWLWRIVRVAPFGSHNDQCCVTPVSAERFQRRFARIAWP